jgi:hypothetical protein
LPLGCSHPSKINFQISSRALWQLAFARCLATLLPNLRGPIEITDPALTSFDRRVLAACGCLVAPAGDCSPWDPAAGGASGDAGQGTFIYAPYCPHAVNGELVEANLGRLQQIAYLGTCFEYYEALDDLETTARRRRQQGSAADQEGLSNGSGGSGSSEGESDGGGSSGGGESGGGGDGEGESVSGGSSGGGESSSGGDGGDATSNQAAAAAGRPDDVTSCGAGCGLGSGGELLEGTGLLADLRRHGRVLELAVPRFGLIHGVTLRLHVFPRRESL